MFLFRVTDNLISYDNGIKACCASSCIDQGVSWQAIRAAASYRTANASGKVLTDALGPEGQRIKTRPRGFYLRKQFTQAILQQHFGHY